MEAETGAQDSAATEAATADEPKIGRGDRIDIKLGNSKNVDGKTDSLRSQD